MARPQIHILNGPNLNLLGEREPEIYGKATLADIEKACKNKAKEAGADLVFEQTNAEGALVDQVQAARKTANALIINPGGYTHTSVALRDVVSALTIPVIELHLSNIHAREPFRQHSYLSGVVTGVICGLGAEGYILALDAALRLTQNNPSI